MYQSTLDVAAKAQDGSSMVRSLSLYVHPRRDIASLAARAGVKRPSSGLAVVDLLVQPECTTIDLFGFDFYESSSLSGNQTIKTTPHDFKKERTFVTEIVARDSRLRLCG